MGRFAAIILAAGQGKRMCSPLPKVLHRVGGKPLLTWVVETARAAGAERVVAVLGVGRAQVEAVLPAGVESVAQEPQLGTGHAARCAEGRLKEYAGPIAVLSGDVPLLRAASVRALAEAQAREGAALAVLTARVSGAHAYGRVVRDAAGRVARIVEHRDASEAERAIDEINTGTYVFGPGELFPALAGLRNENAQGEYYLTDAVAWLTAQGKKVTCVLAPRADECLGINTPEELAAAEQALQGRGR
jgi:bifunctional UDP-N-acetylglucosamine pyrophosphorylase/glucosamine-1-phosphate N-acetyltransferase